MRVVNLKTEAGAKPQAVRSTGSTCRENMCAVTIAKLKDAIPILDVRVVDRALRFYEERLGFHVDFRYAEAPDNYAGVRRDEVCLHMQWQEGIHFDQGTAGRLRIRIPVDDPDSLFQEFAAKGVLNETVRVANTPWGTREFGFRDPDGNGLIFHRELSDSEHLPRSGEPLTTEPGQ